MNITNDYPVTIFRNDTQYGTFYKVGISKKDINGNYINGYKDCRFKKDVQLEDKTKIYIKKAWLDFYVKDKKTIDYIFISEFETLENTIAAAKQETVTETIEQKSVIEQFKQDPFTSIEIEDSDLPF